jgi:hypothetical protein
MYVHYIQIPCQPMLSTADHAPSIAAYATTAVSTLERFYY